MHKYHRLLLLILITSLPLLAAPGASAQVLAGNQQLAGSNDSNNAGLAQAFQYTAVASGTSIDVDLYLRAGTTATSVQVGVYGSTTGKPGSLLASGTISSPQSAAWNDVTVQGATLTAGQSYWIALLPQGGQANYLDTPDGTAASYVESNHSLTGLPQTYTAGSEYNVSPASVYINGRPAAASVLMGDQQLASSSDSNNAGLAQAFEYTAGVSGTSNDIELYLRAGTTATSVQVGLYGDEGGKPGSLEASGTLTSPQSAAWNDVTVQGATLTAGQLYWIALLPQGGQANYLDTTDATASSYVESNHSLTGLPSAYALGSEYNVSPASAYVEGVVTTGGSAPTSTAVPTVTGTAQQGNMLSATNGSWTNSPTSYADQWQDCNTSGASCSAITGATSASYMLTGTSVGDTIRAVVTATNAGGSAPASSAATSAVTVAAPAAPSNTTLPSVSGQATQGQTLTTSNGSWSNSPTGYTYAWADCNAAGASCATINGATASTYLLASADVGHTVGSVVTATNPGGSGSASSVSVGPVTAAVSSGTNCAGVAGSSDPNYASMDACGFPSPDTTGVPTGTSLTASGSITASATGEVINALNVTGNINVTASNVTIENSNITATGTSNGAINIGSGVSGTIVKYDTIHGSADTGSGALQAGVQNLNYSDSAAAVTIDHVDFYNGERIMHGPGTLTNSFCLDDGTVSGAHYECIYEGGGGITINHNTLLVAHTQTAAIFVSTDFAALGAVQITNNLLAGGGYVIYGDATNENNYGDASETVTGNRFSRLYYADSGYWGTDAYMPSNASWSGNVWDDTGQTVSP